jgi:hypothetical protein
VPDRVECASSGGDAVEIEGSCDCALLPDERPFEDLATRGHDGCVPPDPLIDIEALRAYRERLDELRAEIDQATRDTDLGSSERLVQEHDQLLAEVRRTTGLGGRIRTVANDPAERARKAVSGRIRDAIRRLDSITPRLAAHLDRSIRTGLRCAYVPTGADASIRWRVDA